MKSSFIGGRESLSFFFGGGDTEQLRRLYCILGFYRPVTAFTHKFCQSPKYDGSMAPGLWSLGPFLGGTPGLWFWSFPGDTPVRPVAREYPKTAGYWKGALPPGQQRGTSRQNRVSPKLNRKGEPPGQEVPPPPPNRTGGTLPDRTGVPPGLATLQAVRLLLSRRRTFLFLIINNGQPDT